MKKMFKLEIALFLLGFAAKGLFAQGQIEALLEDAVLLCQQITNVFSSNNGFNRTLGKGSVRFAQVKNHVDTQDDNQSEQSFGINEMFEKNRNSRRVNFAINPARKDKPVNAS